jgi:hypothetical protein
MADKIIYTGETDRTRGLFRFQVFEELPAYLEEQLKENPALAARFMEFKKFASRRPPGSRVRRQPAPVTVSRTAPPIKAASHTKR